MDQIFFLPKAPEKYTTAVVPVRLAHLWIVVTWLLKGDQKDDFGEMWAIQLSSWITNAFLKNPLLLRIFLENVVKEQKCKHFSHTWGNECVSYAAREKRLKLNLTLSPLLAQNVNF